MSKKKPHTFRVYANDGDYLTRDYLAEASKGHKLAEQRIVDPGEARALLDKWMAQHPPLDNSARCSITEVSPRGDTYPIVSFKALNGAWSKE